MEFNFCFPRTVNDWEGHLWWIRSMRPWCSLARYILISFLFSKKSEQNLSSDKKRKTIRSSFSKKWAGSKRVARIEFAIAIDFFRSNLRSTTPSSIKWIFLQGLSVCKTPNRWPADDIRFFSHKMQWTLYTDRRRLLMDKQYNFSPRFSSSRHRPFVHPFDIIFFVLTAFFTYVAYYLIAYFLSFSSFRLSLFTIFPLFHAFFYFVSIFDSFCVSLLDKRKIITFFFYMDIVIGNGEIFERKVNDARLARIDTRLFISFL